MMLALGEAYLGDCRELLKQLSSESVHCIVTSPPYWGLRNYGTGPQLWPDGWRGELGLEPTPELYVQHMTLIFRECRRVLRKDGTLWLNLGDSYWSDTLSRKDPVESMWGNRPASDLSTGRNAIPQRNQRGGLGVRPRGLKPKDLVGIPWMVAFALRADGWYLRQENIWHKPNPMPESVQDRCTKSHESIFLFSKSPRYFFDHLAIAEPAGFRPARKFGAGGRDVGRLRNDDAREYSGDTGSRNRRSVWTIATVPYPEAHYAVFPPAIPRLCILAGCPQGGTVLDPFCGSGTTLAVAIELDRRCIGIELDPKNLPLIEARCDPARKRLAAAKAQGKLSLEN